MVWKLPSDLLDTICVDRLRFRKMPTAAEFAKAKHTNILEIVQLTTGSWAGKFDCKYDYNADSAKPDLTSANAWIGLSQPAPAGNWQFESKNYQHWSRVGADGRFTIPHVRPGTYTLSAFADGAFGEFEKIDVEIKAGATTDLADLTWTIPRNRGKLVWEIGIPMRDQHPSTPLNRKSREETPCSVKASTRNTATIRYPYPPPASVKGRTPSRSSRPGLTARASM